jgi:hypothetical protein
MIYQKKKHKKYNKTLNGKKTLSLNQLKKNKRESLIKQNLYKLPLDIKILIFQFSMISNMIDWSLKHQKYFIKNIEFISNKAIYISDKKNPFNHYNHPYDYFGEDRLDKSIKNINKYSRWNAVKTRSMNSLINKEYYFNYKYIHICQRKVKENSQPGIISIYLPDNLYEEIDNREWSNMPEYYWYHKKCRCLKCDLVRVIGANNNILPKDEQEKYSFIDWPVWSDQWFPKTIKQYTLNTNIS